MVREIARLHGGTLMAANVPTGGADVMFTLSLVRRPAAVRTCLLYTSGAGQKPPGGVQRQQVDELLPRAVEKRQQKIAEIRRARQRCV